MSILDKPDAMAALGALDELAKDFSGLSSVPNFEQRIRRRLERGSIGLSIRPEELANVSLSAEEIDKLGATWERYATETAPDRNHQSLRLLVDSTTAEDDRKIADALRRASSVGCVTFVDRSFDGPARWGWPLTVRTIGPIARDAIEGYWHQQLLEYEPTVTEGCEADLLIIDSLEGFLDAQVSHMSAGFLLVMTEEKDAVNVETLRRLNEIVRFRAGAIIEQQYNPREVFRIFIDNLSHDSTPDSAIAGAAEWESAQTIAGDPDFLKRARVSATTRSLEGVVERRFAEGRVDRGAFSSMLDRLERAPSPVDLWTSEEGAATDTVAAAEPVRSELGERSIPEEDEGQTAPRHLQAQVFTIRSAAPAQRTKSFEAGAPHRIDVRIGPTDLDWLSVAREFPDHRLPNSEARLTVTLIAPALFPGSEAREIIIGPTGASTVARFDVDVADTVTSVDVTIIIYHEGKHLQTGVLSGPVTRGEDCAEATGIGFERGAASSADLDHQSAFDLTIWKDRHQLELRLFDRDAPAGEPSHTPLRPSLSGIDRVMDGIRGELFAAARKIEMLGTDIATSGIETLRSLAAQGEFLKGKLFDADTASRIQRIQVVSPDSTDFFPVEFLYDYASPDDTAELCPEFKRAKSPGCSENCTASADNAGIVCPSGFWSLNRVIERQVRPADRTDSQQQESSGRHPNFAMPHSIIFTASDEVNADNEHEVDETIAAMAAVAEVYKAESWARWQELIAEHYPSLLVMLPHNVESTPFNKLRTAAADDLALHRIKHEHVAPALAEVGPAMLLLGCNTANPDVGYQDFVSEMRSKGAVLVIATLTYVLGGQAACVAREFVKRFGEAEDGKPLGEVMRQVRARMLAEDNIMALAITAYGDADWRIALGGH